WPHIADGGGGRTRQAGDQSQQRRLARSRTPEQTDDLALGQAKLDAVEHEQFVPVGFREGLPEVVSFQQRCRVHAEYPSAQAVLAFCESIERPPERPVEYDDKQAHHANSERYTVKIAVRRCLRDISANPVCLQALIPPARDLRCSRSTSRRRL